MIPKLFRLFPLFHSLCKRPLKVLILGPADGENLPAEQLQFKSLELLYLIQRHHIAPVAPNESILRQLLDELGNGVLHVQRFGAGVDQGAPVRMLEVADILQRQHPLFPAAYNGQGRPALAVLLEEQIHGHGGFAGGTDPSG